MYMYMYMYVKVKVLALTSSHVPGEGGGRVSKVSAVM